MKLCRLVALMLVTIAARAATSSARDLTVELWSGRSLSHLTATTPDPHQGPIQVEWSPQGLRLSTGKVLKDLSLSGTFRIQASAANDGKIPQEIMAAGKWNVLWQNHGLKLLLTLPSEDYVKAALNGEAAADEPIASLKAMAITMRTFALANANRHRAAGFGLCDNTHCQALRLEHVRPDIERAVRETAGETLWFHGQRAHVYYTQHCGGANEGAGNVWPAEKAPYLAGGRTDLFCMRRSAATWHARIPLARLGEIFQAQGWHTPFPIQSVRVTERTPGGRARQLEVRGQGMAATVSASSARFAVNRVMGWNQIRSDWFSATVDGDSLEIDGKGYGHGVGLCQAGAYEMAREGHTENEILAFYFPGTHAGITDADQGWHSVAGEGWTLLTTSTDSSLLATGNIAWRRAHSLLGGARFPGKPSVQELPDTELFRQTANEPGWMLAATRGDAVFLQPAAVRRSSGDDTSLLLHEFLHVLVEQHSGERTPLWLREGMVEALANPAHANGAQEHMSIREVNAGLARPSDPVASRNAHKAAGQITHSLLQEYGLPTVCEFLRNGVPASALRVDASSDRR